MSPKQDYKLLSLAYWQDTQLFLRHSYECFNQLKDIGPITCQSRAQM